MNNPNTLPKVVKLSQAQLATIAGGGTVTKGTNTFTADEDTIYLTDDTSVSFEAQSLSSAQQLQARTNIGAGTSSFSGNYNDLSNKPTIPTTTGTVTNGSTAALTSGGAYTYLQQKPTIVQDLVSTAITATIQPASEYYYGELTSITLTFANGSLGDLFYITFSSGATPTDIILTGVTNAKWDTNFTVDSNVNVEICGKWNGTQWLILMTQL